MKHKKREFKKPLSLVMQFKDNSSTIYTCGQKIKTTGSDH